MPKSFCLDNYAGTEQLDGYGWAKALAGRERLQWLEGDEDADWFIDTVFKDPLFNDSHDDLFWFEHPVKSIKHITVTKAGKIKMSLDRFSNSFHQKMKNEAIEIENRYPELSRFERLIKVSDEQREAHRKYYSTALDSVHISPLNRKEIYLSVDINCSNQQLIDQFQEVLVSAREPKDVTQGKQFYGEKDFARWHKYGVIPFIDLTMWADANNVNIAQHLMGDVLFPNELKTDTTQTIRQTVKPLVEKLLKTETLNTLVAQYVRQKKDK